MQTNVIIHGDNLEVMQDMESDSVDLVIASPPYMDCRTYGIGFKLRGQGWVDWMVPRVVEMCRVSSGLVCINMSSKVKAAVYCPAVEWLVADLTRLHGVVCGPSPYVFKRGGVPGSGGKQYHRRKWEPVYCFARPENIPLRYSDNLATGHPPKFKAGGAPTHRRADGTRANGTRSTDRRPNGERKNRIYVPPKISNSGNIIDCGAGGGGHLGSMAAHENEAPFPEKLPDFFIRSYCPPSGIVLDPFIGGGTTAAVAERLGRRWLGIDIRENQCDLSRRRIATVSRPLFQE